MSACVTSSCHCVTLGVVQAAQHEKCWQLTRDLRSWGGMITELEAGTLPSLRPQFKAQFIHLEVWNHWMVSRRPGAVYTWGCWCQKKKRISQDVRTSPAVFVVTEAGILSQTIQWFHTYKCSNWVLNCGRWLGSVPASNSMIIPLNSWDRVLAANIFYHERPALHLKNKTKQKKLYGGLKTLLNPPNHVNGKFI